MKNKIILMLLAGALCNMTCPINAEEPPSYAEAIAAAPAPVKRVAPPLPPKKPKAEAAAAVAVALSPITQEGEDALNAAVNTLDVPTVQAVLNQHLVTAELIRMELILLNFNFGNKMNSEKSKKVDAMRKFLEAQHDELQKTLPEINPTLSDDEVQKQLQKAIKVGNQFEAQQALNKVKAILDRCRVTLPVFKNVYTSYRLAAEPWQHHPTIREIGELLRDFAKKNNYPWGD